MVPAQGYTGWYAAHYGRRCGSAAIGRRRQRAEGHHSFGDGARGSSDGNLPAGRPQRYSHQRPQDKQRPASHTSRRGGIRLRADRLGGGHTAAAYGALLRQGKQAGRSGSFERYTGAVTYEKRRAWSAQYKSPPTGGSKSDST